MLQDTLKIAGNQITLSNIRVHQRIAPGVAKVHGNRQELQQVLLNLIINAVQAMPSGGDLTIAVDQEKDNRINITIQDTGIGISEKHLPHIFDPFFTTKDVGQGTGLGLSVSYGIINKHGGRITVDSCEGKGCKFNVIIPTVTDSSNE